ncbi:MAG TPA: hypothetical protein VHD36_21820 [Pirellulales bacterium]|nr:hypothetical protein [Pirellulales bacterium]
MARLYYGIVLSLGVIAATTIGCSKPAAPAKPTSEAQTMAPAEDNEEAAITKAMAELPEAERAVAMAQKTCPVGDSPLGSMGMPYKVTVKGRDVYLCCEGCKESIEKDPDKYLAKIDQQAEARADK